MREASKWEERINNAYMAYMVSLIMRLADISCPQKVILHCAIDSASLSRRVEPSKEDFSYKTCSGLYTQNQGSAMLTPSASRFPNTPVTTWQTNSGAPTNGSRA